MHATVVELPTYETLSEYDRLRAGLKEHALWTKPSTRQHTAFTGKTETFVIVTAREPELGDYIFVDCLHKDERVTRLVLPPSVANVIASQRDSLTARRRSAAGKARALTLTEDDKQVLRDRLKSARAVRGKRKKGRARKSKVSIK